MVKVDRASQSARLVALVALARAERPGFAALAAAPLLERTERVLAAAGLLSPRLRRWMHSRYAQSGLDLQERFVLPGISAHLLVRKRWFDDEVRAAVGHGARQLVVLGAGFDTLASRLRAEHPDLRAFEVDHPPTQALKRRGLTALPEAERPVLVPLDLLVTTLADALRAAPDHRTDVESVFVAEGLLMYLDEESVRRTLRAFRALAPPGSRLVGTFLVCDAEGRPSMGRRPGLMRWRARRAGEAFRWCIDPARLGDFLREEGLRLLSAPAPDELEARYLSEPRDPRCVLGVGERFFVAEHPEPPAEPS